MIIFRIKPDNNSTYDRKHKDHVLIWAYELNAARIKGTQVFEWTTTTDQIAIPANLVFEIEASRPDLRCKYGNSFFLRIPYTELKLLNKELKNSNRFQGQDEGIEYEIFQEDGKSKIRKYWHTRTSILSKTHDTYNQARRYLISVLKVKQ